MIAHLRVSLGSKKVCIAKNLAGLFLRPETISVELLPKEEPNCAVMHFGFMNFTTSKPFTKFP